MRARSLKPSLFRNELLAVTEPLNTVIFEGLWCLADRAGRLEDREAKIHLEINPGRAFEGTKGALAWLAENGFILRYEVNQTKFIQVLAFAKHQNPHVREPESTIPAPYQNGAGIGLAPDQHSAGPSDSGLLTPDSGLLTPPYSRGGTRASVVLHESLPAEEWAEWLDHRKRKRWPSDAVTLRKQLKLLARYPTETQREMLDTAIQAGWQGLFPPKGPMGVRIDKPRVRAKTADELEAEEQRK